MAGKIIALARGTCSAEYMIRANWSLIGGLELGFRRPGQGISGRRTPDTGGSESFASQIPLPEKKEMSWILLPRDSHPSKFRKSLIKNIIPLDSSLIT
jgi:hypothetical protein